MYRISILLLAMVIAFDIQAQEFEGFALYGDGNSAFLIDKNGDIAHNWNLDTRGNYASFIKDNGNLVRGAVYDGNVLGGAAIGGKVEEYTPAGDLVWEFIYSSASHVQHHDITAMPDGGVMLIAWEVPTLAELQALGYEGTTVKWPTHFIEVQQDGTGGKIVWEWHMKDHFIQEVDPTLPNYGVIANNPQLMDINVAIDEGGGGPGGNVNGDWFHANGIDYNEEFDQIVFTSRLLSEVIIIDHSTTTAEAASHSGGNSGKGGDLLWRWGNPANYQAIGNKNIDGPVHDSRFIPDDGRLNGGYVQIFNNEGTTGSSQVDGIILPRDGYNFTKVDGLAYGPDLPDWTHECRDDANGQSASDKLPNGNTFVNLSREYMYEVDKDDNLVWQFAEGPSKAFRYVCDHPGIQTLIDQGLIDAGLCGVSATNDVYSNPFVVSPNPSKGTFMLSDFQEGAVIVEIVITDMHGKNIKRIDKDFYQFDLENYESGTYFMTVHFNSGDKATKRIILSK